MFSIITKLFSWVWLKKPIPEKPQSLITPLVLDKEVDNVISNRYAPLKENRKKKAFFKTYLPPEEKLDIHKSLW